MPENSKIGSSAEAALEVLATADPVAKCNAARDAFEALKVGKLRSETENRELPDRPARPDRPPLTPPKDVPRRRIGSIEGRIALLHALAHIEFNAIDLAFDMAVRFLPACEERFGEGADFVVDWFSVGADEARHFTMLNDRLAELGSHYGALNAHDGLWQAALATKDNWRARLVVVPMALEARGLDVTPQTVERLREKGDEASAAILDQIYHDEIRHVATGIKWFRKLCEQDLISEDVAFHKDLEDYSQGILKPPFNEEARTRAGFLPKLYMGAG